MKFCLNLQFYMHQYQSHAPLVRSEKLDALSKTPPPVWLRTWPAYLREPVQQGHADADDKVGDKNHINDHPTQPGVQFVSDDR